MNQDDKIEAVITGWKADQPNSPEMSKYATYVRSLKARGVLDPEYADLLDQAGFAWSARRGPKENSETQLRNETIRDAFKSGEKVSKLADRFNLTRQRIFQILKEKPKA